MSRTRVSRGACWQASALAVMNYPLPRIRGGPSPRDLVLAVICVYLGIIAALVGCIALLRPLRFLRITSRNQGAAVLLIGLLLVVVGWTLPAREVRVAPPRTRLDEFAPVYQFNEVHAIGIGAPRDEVYRAIKLVTANEIRLFRTLTWIRRFGRPGPESILNAPERLPILEVATRTTFLMLADEKDRELVLGTIVAAPPESRELSPTTPDAFRTLTDPGFAKAAMNFRIQPDGRGGSFVSTETRVFATDAPTRRGFARYWRVIYPGSALIRRGWLGAIRRRAEDAGEMAGTKSAAPRTRR